MVDATRIFYYLYWTQSLLQLNVMKLSTITPDVKIYISEYTSNKVFFSERRSDTEYKE